MQSRIHLIYGHDALCGWCYAFIPALRAFASTYPHVPIEVVSGGLFSGNRVRPYSTMFNYIEGAFARVRSKTGRHGSDQFFTMITALDTGLIASAPPTYALMQLKRLAPDRTVEFAHALQEAHFEQGHSLNDPITYDRVLTALGLPQIDSQEIVSATDDHSLVRESYARSATLGIYSYPTCLVVDGEGNRLGTISGIYEPAQFVATFDGIVSDSDRPVTAGIGA